MTVIPIRPVETPVCSNCEHGLLGSDGVHCRLLNEPIWDETCAAECDAYEPQ